MSDQPTPAPIAPGDWVAFMSHISGAGRIVYGRVEYVRKQERYRWSHDVVTTAGTVEAKDILEVRRG